MEYRILGPLEVRDTDQEIALGGAKQRALLAVLLLHANTAVSRDRLIDELWGDEPPETARATLHADRFERLVRGAHGRPLEVQAERLREALALWRGGHALADLDDSVGRSERARLGEQRLTALERRIDADLGLGRHAELVPELDALVRDHPVRERFRGQLMLALYRSGRQADALEAYREGRRLLDEELGLEPSEELK